MKQIITKFIYLYLLNRDRKTEYRNMIADTIYELKEKGCNEELITKQVKFYK